jgi:hypothetical protein
MAYDMIESIVEEYLYHRPEMVGAKRWLARQMKVPHFGELDLLGLDYYDALMVVELKHAPINAKAILQVCRYAYDIEAGLSANQPRHEQPVRKVVMGTGLRDADLYYSALGVGVALMTYEWSQGEIVDLKTGRDVLSGWGLTRERRRIDVGYFGTEIDKLIEGSHPAALLEARPVVGEGEG